MYNIKNIQNNNNLVVVNSKKLILNENYTKDCLKIERREKNTYYSKIVGVKYINNNNNNNNNKNI